MKSLTKHLVMGLAFALAPIASAELISDVTFTGEVYNISRKVVVLKTRNRFVKIPRKYFKKNHPSLRPGKVVKVKAFLPEILRLNSAPQKNRKPARR